MTIHNHITLVGRIDNIVEQSGSDMLFLRVTSHHKDTDGNMAMQYQTFGCLLRGRVRDLAALLTNGDLVSIGATLEQTEVRDRYGALRIHTLPVVEEIHVLDVRVSA